ncbi:MAG: hypothetical protein HON53_14815 [Planctomycetaceae bacterium]|nr:hypothetical protein [Planctomycetaceae bacterium]MBT6497607.1 hypothetical protein [Planctomycetaceae bacterium]
MSCLLVLLTSNAATAQVSTGAQLSARLRTRTATARAGVPMTLVWDFKWTGFELLEGHLEIAVSDGREQMGHIKTDDIVISTGERRLETRMPVHSKDGLFQQVSLQAVLVTADRRFDLGEFPLRLQPYGTRTMTIGISDPWDVRFSPRQTELTRSVRLDRFNPESQDESMKSSFGHLAPSELPSDPTGYCVYNLVVLMDEGFSELRPKQLGALYDWVAAGGSVCIMPGGGLGADHIDFLNRLAARDEQASPMLLDTEGRLIQDGDGDRATIRLLHTGMGRAGIVIAANDTIRNPESTEWREMVAFLWNVHAQWVPALARDGNWNAARIPNSRTVNRYTASTAQKFEYRPISQGNWLLERLMPPTVQVVPLGLIGLILSGYVLLIGPVDYFLLGAFKQRKLTWILFPLVTVGVTMFTVWLSQWYMQPSEDRRTVEFLDVGDDGNIARRSRFELLFNSTPRLVKTKVTGEIFAQFNQQQFSSRAQQMYQQYGNSYGGQELIEQFVGPADYEGRFPSNYTVSQQIGQWVPQINRFFSIPAAGDDANGAEQKEFDWRSLKPSRSGNGLETTRDEGWKNTVRQRVQQQFGSEAAIWVMTGANVDQIAGSHGLFLRQYNQYQNTYGYRGAVPSYAEEEQASADSRNNTFLTQTCKRPRTGLYKLVSRIAPTGGDTFEDLAVLDPTDLRQCLLVVAVEQEDNLKVYRKLYIMSE